MRHINYSNVVSTLCLFVVLGGGAYAATQIDGKQLKPRSITGKKIRKDSLGGAVIRESKLRSVPRARAADRLGSLTESDIQKGLLWARYDYLFTTGGKAPTAEHDTLHGLKRVRIECNRDENIVDSGPPIEVPNPEARGCEDLSVHFVAKPGRDLRKCAYTATVGTRAGGRVDEVGTYSEAFGGTPGPNGEPPVGTDGVVVQLELEDGYYDKTNLAPGLSLHVVCP